MGGCVRVCVRGRGGGGAAEGKWGLGELNIIWTLVHLSFQSDNSCFLPKESKGASCQSSPLLEPRYQFLHLSL